MFQNVHLIDAAYILALFEAYDEVVFENNFYLDSLAESLPTGWYLICFSDEELNQIRVNFFEEGIQIPDNPLLEFGKLLKQSAEFTQLSVNFVKWLACSSAIDSNNLVVVYEHRGQITPEQADLIKNLRAAMLSIIHFSNYLAVPEKLVKS